VARDLTCPSGSSDLEPLWERASIDVELFSQGGDDEVLEDRIHVKEDGCRSERSMRELEASAAKNRASELSGRPIVLVQARVGDLRDTGPESKPRPRKCTSAPCACQACDSF
jgi:hypothetical protein